MLNTREWLEKLVAADTTSHLSNLGLIEDVKAYLQGEGAVCRVTYNPEKTKANLLASFGPADKAGLVLSGHTDVVPVDGQDWASNPFSIHEADGNLYGRGTCDMKGFIAVVLGLVPQVKKFAVQKPLHIALSFDEEIGCMGVKHLLDDLAQSPIAKPAFCLIGEPTEMQPIAGHKGIYQWWCHVHGRAGHSSQTHVNVSAIEHAATLVNEVSALHHECVHKGPYDDNFTPPHSTLHVGVIEGGTADNIIAQDCKFIFEIRPIPGHDPRIALHRLQTKAESVEKEMRKVAPEAGVKFEEACDIPAFSVSPEHPAVKMALNISGANAAGYVSFCTEGGRFHAEDIPCLICGPGSIQQAHKPNEYVSLEQLEKCERFVADFCRQFLRS